MLMSSGLIWNCTHFRHPTGEQLRLIDIIGATIIYSLSALNCVLLCCLLGAKWFLTKLYRRALKEFTTYTRIDKAFLLSQYSYDKMNRACAPAVDAKVPSRFYPRNYLRLVYTLHLIVLRDKSGKGHFEITPSK